MRCLVVDAFDQNLCGRKALRYFVRSINRAFACADPEGASVHTTVAPLDALEDFIYVDHEDRENLTKIKRFDRLDFVFVGGDPEVLPWSAAAKQLYILMRMCFITNKCIFGTSIGAQIFALLCATKGYQQVNVINGVRGGGIRDLVEEDIGMHHQVVNAKVEMFLDAESGDLFQMDKAHGCWIPFSNSGIKLLRKQPREETKRYYCKDKLAELYLNKVDSKQCVIAQSHVRHWAVRDLLQHAFVVKSPARWTLNEAANERSPQKYTVLARMKDMPAIIARKNALFLCFEVTTRCPESTQVLSAYVSRCCKRLRQRAYFNTSANLFVTLQTLPTNTNIKTKRSSLRYAQRKDVRAASKESALMETFEHNVTNNACLKRSKSCSMLSDRPRPVSAKGSRKNRLFHRLEENRRRRPRSAYRKSAPPSLPCATPSSILSRCRRETLGDMKVGKMVDRVGFIASLNDEIQPAVRALAEPSDEAIEFYKRKHLTSTFHLKQIMANAEER